MSASNVNLNWITNFIWGIADDVLRDVYVRAHYRTEKMFYGGSREEAVIR